MELIECNLAHVLSFTCIKRKHCFFNYIFSPLWLLISATSFFFHFISPQLITYNKANKIRRFFGVAIVGHEKICIMHNNFPLGMFWHQKKTKKNAKKCEWCWADFWQHSFTATEKEGLKKVRMSHLWICKPKWHICHLGVLKKKFVRGWNC